MQHTIIFHHGCYDGFTAAWVCRRHLIKNTRVPLDSIRVLPARYGDEPPSVRDESVYVLDFSYSRDQLERMHEEAMYMIVLDHHKSAQQCLEGLAYAKFDLDQSGAGMAWRWFFPGIEMPWLVRYVEDRDLWKFEQPVSREVNAYIHTFDFDFTTWDVLFHEGVQTAAAHGTTVWRYIRKQVEQARRNAGRIWFEGHEILCINVTQHTSEVVGALAEGKPFAMGWLQRKDGRYVYNLRSRKGGVDVAKIAERFGGGGHVSAAGFTLDEPLKLVRVRMESEL